MHPSSSLLRRSVLLLLVICATARSAFAHDPGLSSANLDRHAGAFSLVVTYNERDLAGVAHIPAETLSANAPVPAAISELLGRAISLDLGDGQPAAPRSAVVKIDGNGNVELCYEFAEAAGARELAFTSRLLAEMPFGHRQVFTARDEAGREISRVLLSAKADTARVSVNSPVEVSHSFLEFLTLGIRHILSGYDHLLFLFGLLVLCRNTRSAALLVTCFTAAHSLTLGLATFGLVNLPSRFVEATIAASIVYVGVENLVRREQNLRARAVLTFCFGLIHGLGFASVLREMGIGQQGSAAVPLIGFNAGVELGQLTIAALVLPLVWRLSREPWFTRRGIPALSLSVALAGAYWLIERTVF